MSDKIILGSDGELRDGIGSLNETTPQDAQLPELFLQDAEEEVYLLNPANKAFILGKNANPSTRGTQPEKFLGRQQDPRVLIAFSMIVIGFLRFAASRGQYAQDHPGVPVPDVDIALELIVGMVVMFALVGAVGYFVSKRNLAKIESYRRAHGRLLKGEIVFYRHLAANPTQEDEITYRFTTPSGKKITRTELIPLQYRGSSKRPMSVRVGTPVAILYFNSNWYELL